MDQDIASMHGSHTPEEVAIHREAATGSLPATKTGTAAPVADGQDRNGIFARLVEGDDDIAGLVAYSIYKQNKLDWLAAFETAKGRTPDDAERAAYIIGEATPRRIATYRHLAEGTLAGQGPGANGSNATGVRRGLVGADKTALTTTLVATYGLIAILFVIGFWLAAHFTVTR